jgi:hypothetical protein
MATFTITRKLDLSSDQVWAIVSDFTRPPSPAIKIEVEEKGDPDANGIGAIRNININGAKARERLEAVDAPNYITYRMLPQPAIKEYITTVNVVAQEGATLINWDVKLIPRIPGIGWILEMDLRRTINRYIDAIEVGQNKICTKRGAENRIPDTAAQIKEGPQAISSELSPRKWKWQKLVGWGLLIVVFWVLWMYMIELSQLKKVPSPAETMVFKTGGTSILFRIFVLLIGLVCVIFGIAIIVAVKHIITVGLGLFMLVGGGLMLYGICYWVPISQYVVIDKTTEVIEIKRTYLLRTTEEYRVPFADILSVKYKRYSLHSSDNITTYHGSVDLAISDGREVDVSRNGPRSQYKLAKAISNAANKPLLELEK